MATHHDIEDDSDIEILLKPVTRKASSRVTMKGLKESDPSPKFLSTLSTVLADFHIYLLSKNMFPDDIEARLCIQGSIDAINNVSDDEESTPFEPDEKFYKTVRGFHSLNTIFPLIFFIW
jgi:hypothetical protein